MKCFHHLLMPVLRGRHALNMRLDGLLPWHTTTILLNLSQPDLTEEENVIGLRDAASGAPRGVQRVMPVGPNHAMLLLAAVPATARQAIRYADRIAGEGNYVVFADGVAHDRHGLAVAGSRLDVDSLDLWAARLGVCLMADGMFERSPSFLAYAAALDLR